jgi:adenosylhomocysteine nucleosidase
MIVILTALELEGAAVRAHLRHSRLHHHAAGTVFEVGTLVAWPDREVALAEIGMGTTNAAAITERAIAEFQPSAVVFVGIAGGLRDWIALGDVVVATRVYAYQGGRVDGDEFLARPQSWDTSHRLVQLAKLVQRTKAWPGAAESRTQVHFEPIAAGDVVLNSTTAPEHERLRTHYNDAVAVEMESSGVALAGHLCESTPTVAVRGISDLADGNKVHADSAGWQTTAAANAAAFAVGLVGAIQENSSVAGVEPPRGPRWAAIGAIGAALVTVIVTATFAIINSQYSPAPNSVGQPFEDREQFRAVVDPFRVEGVVVWPSSGAVRSAGEVKLGDQGGEEARCAVRVEYEAHAADGRPIGRPQERACPPARPEVVWPKFGPLYFEEDPRIATVAISIYVYDSKRVTIVCLLAAACRESLS